MLSVSPVREDRPSDFITWYAGLEVEKKKCWHVFPIASAVARAYIGVWRHWASLDYICEVNLTPEFIIIGVCLSGVPLKASDNLAFVTQNEYGIHTCITDSFDNWHCVFIIHDETRPSENNLVSFVLYPSFWTINFNDAGFEFLRCTFDFNNKVHCITCLK